MRIVLIAIISSTFVLPSVAAELSPGEIAWGIAAKECLKTEAPACMVKVKQDGHLGLWCPSRTPEYERALASCDKAADGKGQPEEWTPPEK